MRYLILLHIVFIAFFTTANGQQKLTTVVFDSLWNIWQNDKLGDTVRLKAIDKIIIDGSIQEKPDTAIYFARLQYDLALASNQRKFQARALYTHSTSLFKKRDFANSLEICYKAIGIFEELADKPALIAAYINIASINFNQGNYSLANENYIRSKKIAEEIGEKRRLTVSCNGLGNSYQFLGDFVNSLKNYSTSLEILTELGDKESIAVVLGNMATVYLKLGDLNKALENNYRSLAIHEEISNKSGIAAAYGNIGNVFLTQGNYSVSMAYYQKMVELCKVIDNPRLLVIAYNNIGTIYKNQADYENALEYYSLALKIAEERDDKPGITRALNNIGNNYGVQGDYQQSKIYLLKSLYLAQKVGLKGSFTTSYNNIGNVYFFQDSIDKAVDYYSRSLLLSEETGSKKSMVTTYNSLGNLYFSERRYDLALKNRLKAFGIAQESEFETEVLDAVNALYSIYIKLDKKIEALTYLYLLRQNLMKQLEVNYFTLSAYNKELYFTTLEENFGKYYDFTLFNHEKYPGLKDTTYNLILQNKGLSLKSSTAMRSSINNSNDTSLIARYEKWIQLKQNISELYTKGKNAKKEENIANDLEKELINKSEVFNSIDKIRNLDWKVIRTSLKPNESAIEFIHFRSEIDSLSPIIYAALLIKPDCIHPEIIKLCNEEELLKILSKFKGNSQKLVNSIYGTKNEAEMELYNKLWKPMEEYLHGVKTIYFSPSGLLNKISFSAISKSKNLLLSDLYDFKQMNSTGILAFNKSNEVFENESFLLMGGINYNKWSTKNNIWSYLPGTLSETEEINSLLLKKKYNVQYFNADSASEENFKLKIQSSNVAHIATHGFFYPDPEQIEKKTDKKDSVEVGEIKFRGNTNYADWSFVKNKNPLMRSGIILAHANDVWSRDALSEGEDGILTAQEVSNLDLLKLKLVVLSACETGLGDIKGTEGVYGLQRAFKMAGVKYIIMSLWQVPDKETSEYMITFYEKLIKVKDIRKAFSETQKEMRIKYDPYYWGAFVLIE